MDQFTNIYTPKQSRRNHKKLLPKKYSSIYKKNESKIISLT